LLDGPEHRRRLTMSGIIPARKVPWMNFLITGAAAFGSHLANSWFVKATRSGGLDRPLVGNLDQPCPPECRSPAGTWATGPNFWTVLQEIDCVYHLAARVPVPESVLYPREYQRVNVGGHCQPDGSHARCGVRRVVFISSAPSTVTRANNLAGRILLPTAFRLCGLQAGRGVLRE